jgi:tryptophan synthase alpha chain
MSRIRKAFAGKKAFIPFITCGDPDIEVTAQIVRKAAEAGADLMELEFRFPIPQPRVRSSWRRMSVR